MITLDEILEVAAKDGPKTDEDLFISGSRSDEEVEGLLDV